MRVIVLLGGLSLLALLVWGVLSAPDLGRCLENHEKFSLMPMPGPNNTTLLMPTWTTVCDRWEYPEGKPK